MNPTIGDTSSFVGVIIAFIGFSITIYNVIRSKRAANRAEKAANQALESVRHIDAVQKLSSAIAIVEEMQRLNRAKDWKVLLDRHSTFRNLLIEVRGSADNLSEEHKANILDGINHSGAISYKVEVALAKGEDPDGIPRMNKILSEQAGKLASILIALRMKTEG